MQIFFRRFFFLLLTIFFVSQVGLVSAGTVSGVIKFVGKIPDAKQLSVNKDKKICGKKPIFDQTLLVKNDGIQYAVVSIEGVKKKKKWSKKMKKVLVDQKGCIYLPRVVAMKIKGKLTIKNSDKILHNVHTYPGKTGNKTANIAQPKFKKKLKMSKRFFSKPGIVKITCDVHNWMVGYVAVSKHPYISVTGKGGKFEISDVPAGKYKVKVWHEKLGKKEQVVTVKSSGKTELAIQMN
ncbi:MAG: hypothetical protein VX794_02285 [Nitrospinota bacterium]|nr:hypothetical protein [Nitrospinota bacterium]